MPVSKLTPFSYVILLLVGSHGAAPHDLVRMQRQGNWIYWTAAESRFYSEPKRLSELGYLATRREPGRTTDRTLYTLSDAGREAVARWLAEPSGFIRIQNEPAARLTGADLATDDRTVLRSLLAIEPMIAEQLAWLDRAEREASALPHRERYLRTHLLPQPPHSGGLLGLARRGAGGAPVGRRPPSPGAARRAAAGCPPANTTGRERRAQWEIEAVPLLLVRAVYGTILVVADARHRRRRIAGPRGNSSLACSGRASSSRRPRSARTARQGGASRALPSTASTRRARWPWRSWRQSAAGCCCATPRSPPRSPPPACEPPPRVAVDLFRKPPSPLHQARRSRPSPRRPSWRRRRAGPDPSAARSATTAAPASSPGSSSACRSSPSPTAASSVAIASAEAPANVAPRAWSARTTSTTTRR